MPDWIAHLYTPVLLVVYFLSMIVLARRDDPSDDSHPGASTTLKRALLSYGIATLAVAIGGVGLAEGGDRIAEEMGWSASFVGTLLLAASTSLPEIATSVTLLRLGSRDMAVGNMVGSNLFNTGVILFIYDLSYTQGTLPAAISEVHLSSIWISAAMTAVVALSILSRPRRTLVGRASPEAIILMGLFVLSHAIAFAA